MAACLISQANVVAAMVQGICLGPTNSGQVAPTAAEHQRGRSRHRGREQPFLPTMAPGENHRQARRRGRHGQSHRC